MGTQALNPGSLNVQETNNQVVPSEGPKAIPILLNFSSGGGPVAYSLDLLLLQQQKRISMVQTIWIDMSGATDELIITIRSSNQVIVAAPGTQGYYNVLVPDPPGFLFSSTAGSGLIPIMLLNIPVPGVVWST